jgi:hypothetical protein
MEKVIDVSRRDRIPTHRAADRMSEGKIRAISEVKKYIEDLRPWAETIPSKDCLEIRGEEGYL